MGRLAVPSTHYTSINRCIRSHWPLVSMAKAIWLAEVLIYASNLNRYVRKRTET